MSDDIRNIRNMSEDAMKFLHEVSRSNRAEFVKRLRDGMVDADRERFFELYLNSASFKAMVTSLAEGMADVLIMMAQVAEGEREVRDKMVAVMESEVGADALSKPVGARVKRGLR